MQRAFPLRADVVVIGGGVVGVSTAYHLAALGRADVVVVEREEALGMGSTGRSAGGVRIQYSTEVNVRLSAWSIEMLRRFGELTGESAGLRQHGYLIVTGDVAEMSRFEQNVALQRSLGFDVKLLDPRRAQALVPQLRVDDLVGATFHAQDGYADPHSVLQGLARKAREMGARLFLATEAFAVDVRGGRVAGVAVRRPPGSRGPGAEEQAIIEARYVVNAAGPYAAEVGRMAGVVVPVKPYRRMVWVTEPIGLFRPDLPMVIDFDSGFYVRREGERLLFGMANPEEGPGFRTDVDWAFLPRVLEAGVHRLPALAEARVRRGWAGLYEVSPDHNAIIGEAPEVRGLYLANGFSGHGFQQAPAVGRVLAEMILGLPLSVDVSPLDIRRFSTGGRLVESQVV
ncbi:FAD-binding oxidoreductase [Carboxydochorda subterranea]|uniref:FAD-binding oxidoreductase n=1 Tax=Carboxydichorda subterranea TaxID=3109565 RepID=A0ABZ1BYF9_9FIRM|nr:FAD-binding oxidoreductase [Limnochorda sp. L945t]WRP17845.1 FAD-binding oxidoreductase [Limnochorda sp. L945t]